MFGGRTLGFNNALLSQDIEKYAGDIEDEFLSAAGQALIRRCLKELRRLHLIDQAPPSKERHGKHKIFENDVPAESSLIIKERPGSLLSRLGINLCGSLSVGIPTYDPEVRQHFPEGKVTLCLRSFDVPFRCGDIGIVGKGNFNGLGQVKQSFRLLGRGRPAGRSEAAGICIPAAR